MDDVNRPELSVLVIGMLYALSCMAHSLVAYSLNENGICASHSKITPQDNQIFVRVISETVNFKHIIEVRVPQYISHDTVKGNYALFHSILSKYVCKVWL